MSRPLALDDAIELQCPHGPAHPLTGRQICNLIQALTEIRDEGNNTATLALKEIEWPET